MVFLGGDDFVNGGGDDLPTSSCNFPCAADASDICGGNWALSLYTDSAASSGNDDDDTGSCSSGSSSSGSQVLVPVDPPSNSSISLPQGWVADGCVSDTPQRTLNAYAYTGEDMTVSACVATCNSKGFTYAGLEYSRECYCGNQFVNGGGDPLPASSCDMTCPTDGNECGGPLALTVYKKTTSTPARRNLKAKHFGRHARSVHSGHF